MTGHYSTHGRWTAAEDAVLREHYATEGAKGCGRMLPGRAVENIAQRAFRLGIKKNKVAATPRMVRREASNLDRLLARRDRPINVPPGWQLVPIDLPANALEVGANEFMRAPDMVSGMRQAWKAALALAPAAPEGI